jgi:hypothetical protein
MSTNNMASLVLITREGRLLLKIGGIFFGILFIIFLFVQGGTMIRDVFFPKPPPAAEQAFGELPHPKFPDQTPEIIEYKLNTVDGLLPTLVKNSRINIYKLKQNHPNLLALQDAKNTLDSGNFVENQIKISDTLYRFTQSRTGVIIEYDIVSKNFSITSNYFGNPSLVATGLLPSEESIISDTQSFLHTIDANTENIDFDKSKVEYLEEKNGALVIAQNLGTARYARITLYQKPIDEISTVYGVQDGSILNFLVSYPSSSFQVLEGIFFNAEANLEEKSDYYVKSTTEAFEDLKAGKAYLINPNKLTSVDITNVEIKYYLTKESEDFLLPIYVFTGSNFTAYVDALAEAPQSSPSQ